MYFDQLSFQKRTQQIVRDAMQQESNTQYDFYYRTAITTDKQQNNIGWVIGNPGKRIECIRIVLRRDNRNRIG